MNTNFGFVRVAAAVPTMKVADCKYNAEQIKLQIDEAIAEGVEVICFPELSLTGYTCADLFFTQALQQSSMREPSFFFNKCIFRFPSFFFYFI